METLMTRLEKPGTHLKITRETSNIEALALHLFALRAQGHAVVADETFDHNGLSVGITVIHYLSCRRCKKGE